MLRTRILTAVVLAVIVAYSVFGLDTAHASLVFAGFWLIGTDEWARLAGLKLVGRVIYAGLFVAVVVSFLTIGLPAGIVNGVFWLAALAWGATFWLVLRFPRPLPRTAVSVMGLIVIAAAWLAFSVIHSQPGDGPGLILAGLAIIWSADVGAYFAGRSLGRTPLAPKVSPKKTWEGVVGGVLLATTAGLLAAIALGRPPVLFGAIAIAMALISVVGDLGVSMLKRHAGQKDAGVLFPGHGGVMDRFDGVTAALPFFVLGLNFAHVLD